ncbi:MAG: hypothetical protein IV100_00700 [Myxococcales bacterium]|nr:hypothetical protein [Myxococcales bacterium]
MPVPLSHSTTERHGLRHYLLALVIAAVGAFTVGPWLVRSVTAIGTPFPLDYGEGPLLDQARRLLDGQPLYPPDLTVPPHVVANYPPLYPALTAAVTLFTGPSYAPGRLFSLIGVLLAAASLGAVARRLTGSFTAGLTTALILVTAPYVASWSLLARVDGLALGLSSLGLALALHGRWRAGLLVVLAAVFTRQTAILVVPLSVFAWASATGSLRDAWRPFTLVAAVGVALGALFLAMTHGGAWFHLVTANVNAFDWAVTAAVLSDLATQLALPITLTVAAVATAARRRDWPVVSLLGAITLLSLIPAVSVGKVGANVNYLFDTVAALALGTGVAVGQWDAAVAPTKVAASRLRWIPALAVCGHLALMARDDAPTSVDLAQSREAGVTVLRNEVKATPGLILADEDLGLLPLEGRPIVYQPFEMTQLARSGHFDTAPLAAAIERGAFSLVLLYAPREWDAPGARWTPDLLAALSKHYVPTGRHADTWVLRPLPSKALAATPE